MRAVTKIQLIVEDTRSPILYALMPSEIRAQTSVPDQSLAQQNI
jgi:ABC-type Zn2+ transport system substrate-binding protein/surface adhesin